MLEFFCKAAPCPSSINLENCSTEKPDACPHPDASRRVDDGQDLLATVPLDGEQLRDRTRAKPMNSVHGAIPSGYAPELDRASTADEDLIPCPCWAAATAAVRHQRRLLASAARRAWWCWVRSPSLGAAAADRSAQQVAATGQSLMQSQRLAKSVSQALVGSPGLPRRGGKLGVLARNVRGLTAGDNELACNAAASPTSPIWTP